MIMNVSVAWMKQLNPAAKSIHDAVGYKSSTQRVKIDMRQLSDKEMEKLQAIVEADKGVGWKSTVQAIETMRLMKADPSGTPVKDLKALAAALTEHFKATPNQWVFMIEDSHRFPYYVYNIEYHPPRFTREDSSPPFTDMTLKAANQRAQTIRWDEADLADRLTLTQLLAERGLQTETKSLVSAHGAEMKLHAEYSDMIGAQMVATGMGRHITRSWWSAHEKVSMEREGQRSKVVIDDGSEHEKDNDDDDDSWSRARRRKRKGASKTTSDRKFWKEMVKPTKRKTGYDEEDDEPSADEDIVALPEHPWLQVFDFHDHQFLEVHVKDVEPYQYDDTLGDKLVLPEDTSDVLYALVRGADEVMEDIIEGKTGGTIVICTGPPGTGKTLTAEAFSEIVQKPLYTVQCSQLGMTPTDLEKQLSIVLQRATRWKALLLIDEADVYIRERGDDISQNAIVGVWLRVLEYYRGILFMTSNKATIIDDAVMNRATAWVRYEPPSKDELTKIWRVLGEQYEMGLSDELIAKLVEWRPSATGRNVKNLIKLAKQLIKTRKHKDLLDLFQRAARFLDVPQERKSAG